MSKHSDITNFHQKSNVLQSSKKLSRSIAEYSKRLDDVCVSARNISDLFSPSTQLLRKKFSDTCELLLFSDSTLNAKTIANLLWRKAFYDPISVAKKIKDSSYLQEENALLHLHVTAAIGYYHHMVSKIQTEYKLQLNSEVDFASSNCSTDETQTLTENLRQWLHQCLTYLGDLNRYKVDICCVNNLTLSRYYMQALHLEPNVGMPFNQMGTLAMSQQYFLDAVYYYMRSLSSSKPFEGTMNNLRHIFETNSKTLVKYKNPTIQKSQSDELITCFLALIDVWYFNKESNNLTTLSEEICNKFEFYLSSANFRNPIDSIDTTSSTSMRNTNTVPKRRQSILNYDLQFKIVAICLLCIMKMSNTHSFHISKAHLFILKILSIMLTSSVEHITADINSYATPLVDNNEDTLLREVLKELKVKKILNSKARRRKIQIKHNVDSDSDDDHAEGDKSEDSMDDDDELFETDLLANDSSETCSDNSDTESSDSKEVSAKQQNDQKSISINKKLQLVNTNDALNFIGRESSLTAIKICCDWLECEVKLVKTYKTYVPNLMQQFVNFVNLLNIKLDEKTKTYLQKHNLLNGQISTALSEDITLKGMQILEQSHKHLRWQILTNNRSLHSKQNELLIRMIKLLLFGKQLTTIEGCGVTLNEQNNVFLYVGNEISKKSNNEQTLNIVAQAEMKSTELNVDKLNGDVNSEKKNTEYMEKMKHMGQLWLASEVKNLEKRMKTKRAFPPYLVLFTDALIKHTYMVKHLVQSRRFIVLIPSATVSALDELKNKQPEARDAIRWLESQFYHGNRYLRSQRAHEFLAIPHIKYPKKKSKEIQNYIEILECCYYLSQKQKNDSILVTLLIDNDNMLSSNGNTQNKGFSFVGLAKTANVSVENISEFYMKWKKTRKGKT